MSYTPSAVEERVAAELKRLGLTDTGVERGGSTMENAVNGTTIAEERFIQATLALDERIVFSFDGPSNHDCAICETQNEYREAADALQAERAAA